MKVDEKRKELQERIKNYHAEIVKCELELKNLKNLEKPYRRYVTSHGKCPDVNYKTFSTALKSLKTYIDKDRIGSSLIYDGRISECAEDKEILKVYFTNIYGVNKESINFLEFLRTAIKKDIEEITQDEVDEISELLLEVSKESMENLNYTLNNEITKKDMDLLIEFIIKMKKENKSIEEELQKGLSLVNLDITSRSKKLVVTFK